MQTNITETTIQPEPEPKSGAATYSPEDNCLRLYIGRVPRDEYEKLKAEGWRALYKQREAGGGDFVATWTPERRDTALTYADIIEDEDMGPAERATDRAERFSGYLGKRLDEATGHADRFESGPQAHGYQSEARAERAAARHDRIADRAGDAWGKAEYWQRRTAGVIAHALYKSSPAVRMGRIKTIEAELRAKVATYEKAAALFDIAVSIQGMEDPEKQTAKALQFFGNISSYREYPHPDEPNEKHSIYSLMTGSHLRKITGKEAVELYLSDRSRPSVETNEWANHYKLRLAYENQMLEAQGGRAAMVEMEVGGWVGSHQIRKVNRSNASGRVVSVAVSVPTHGCDKWGNKVEGGPAFRLETINIERMSKSIYRAPSDEDRAALVEAKKAEKAASPKVKTISLINPTDEDAQKLQDLWNEKARANHERRNKYSDFEPQHVLKLTQAQYSANSSGTYARLQTVTLNENGAEVRETYMGTKNYRHKVCKVRKAPSAGSSFTAADRVVVITDKPQKPLPFAENGSVARQESQPGLHAGQVASDPSGVG